MKNNNVHFKQLPIPTKEAQQQSLLLQKRIHDYLCKNGPVPFSDFMEMALYDPELGYYTANLTKFGKAGDFVTAPEISPFFGATITQSLQQKHSNYVSQSWLELGAGTGKLACHILQFLCQQHVLPETYFICEVSPDLRARQKEYLKTHLPTEYFSRVQWVDECPDNFTGVILANEVLDALPVDRFVIAEEGPKVMCISSLQEESVANEEANQINDGSWIISLTAAQDDMRIRLENLGQTFQLPIGYSSEINHKQEALVKFLSQRLKEGIMLFIDYGYPARIYYHPDRHMGTFRCHYQQHAHEDAFFWPGLQDMTAHVDFTALGRCGIESGLQLLYYGHQGNFLLDAGVLEIAQNACTSMNESARLSHQQALQTLLSPNGMGEQCKVMIFGKNEEAMPRFYSRSDRRFDL